MGEDGRLLQDKVAIVTGSSRGIGAETAKLLAANGAKVAVNFSTSRERAERAACFFTCQAVVLGMDRRGHGSIVNISSGLSRNPGVGYSAHFAAKSALDAFSKSLALELGPAPGSASTSWPRGSPLPTPRPSCRRRCAR